MQGLTVYAPFVGILSLIIAFLIYCYVKKQPNGTPLMQDLEDAIHTGAMAFLKREYRTLSFFVIGVAVVLALALSGTVPGLGWKTAVAFVCGAVLSSLCGFGGMKIATAANARTTQAATRAAIHPGTSGSTHPPCRVTTASTTTATASSTLPIPPAQAGTPSSPIRRLRAKRRSARTGATTTATG